MPLMLLGGINRLRHDGAGDGRTASTSSPWAGPLLREPDLVNRLQSRRAGRGRLHPLQPLHADDLLRHPLPGGPGRGDPGLTADTGSDRVPTGPRSRLATGLASPSHELEPVLVSTHGAGHPREAAARRRLVHRAPSAGTRSRASTPTPTSSWSGSGSSNPAKDGKDAGRAGRARPRARDQGHHRPRRADRAARRTRSCTRAMADDRVFECIEDLIGVRRGRHQRRLAAGRCCCSGPSRSCRRDDRDRIDDAGAARATPACTSTASTRASPTTCCRW